MVRGKPCNLNKPIDFTAAMSKRSSRFAEKQRSSPMETHVHSLQIRILIYEENGEYIAHALEMDLLGNGGTEKEALNTLCGLIDCQISFARQQNDDSLLLFRAPSEYFKRWERAHQAALKNSVFPERSVTLNWKAVYVTLDDRLSRLPKRTFEPVICA
jgi:hypothetical protein